jgi:hypothetical protein
MTISCNLSRCMNVINDDPKPSRRLVRSRKSLEQLQSLRVVSDEPPKMHAVVVMGQSHHC